jgi:anti-sigma B factor antagonist
MRVSEPGEPASVHLFVEDDRTRVVLSGEIDADLENELNEAISDAETEGLSVDVDATHVTFMDSSGIAFLARLATRVQHPGRVLHAPESVRFLLEVTRMHELLEVIDTSDEARGTGLPTIGPASHKPEPPDSVA